jgi:phosphatidylinositol alpha-mannosyltransferase
LVRVALVCPYALVRPGGVQGQVLGLARAFDRCGVDTMVLAPGPLGDVDAPRVTAVGRSVGVPANGSVAPLALGPGAWFRTLVALRRWRPDVVHLHEPLAPGPTWAALAAPTSDALRVGTLHRAGGEALYRWAGPAARLAFARLDALFAVSESARLTAAPALGARACPVVGNGVELRLDRPVEPEPSTGPTVLFVGRHEPRKGLGVLLESVETLGPGWPGRVWVVGSGPESASLMARYRSLENVQWWGAVDDATLARLFAGSHVLCAPSLGGESFGVVLLEAMVARSVVVCSDIAGYSAVVGSHGLQVPPGDSAMLAGALERAVAAVVHQTGLAAPSALDAAAGYAAGFSMEALATRYLRYYEQLTARPGAS